MKIRVISFLLFTIFSSNLRSEDIVILIPGTFSKNSSWYKPGGKFYDYLKKSSEQNNKKLIHFEWSTDNTHKARKQGGIELANLMAHSKPEDKFTLIGYSHGGNVAIIASQELKNLGFKNKIESLFTVATPIDCNKYNPDMDAIECIYNLFSFGDKIQNIGGFFARVLPKHERIANIEIYINGTQPDHFHICETPLTNFIFSIHNDLAKNINTFFTDDSIVCFNDDATYKYEIDPKRNDRLNQEYLDNLEKQKDIKHLELMIKGYTDSNPEGI